MQGIKSFISTHWLGIVIAITLSLVAAFPQIYFRFDPEYQGIELLPDSPWSPRITEVQNGHPGFGSIYYKDGKSDPYLFQPLGSMLVGYGGKLFGLNINNTLLASRLVLPAFVFLLFYFFVYIFSKDKLTALASASVLLFAEAALSFYGISSIAQGLSPDSFLRIARPLNPAMIYIFFFGFLISFWYFYKKPTWRTGIASAVLLGLNFYNYFYSWTFLYAFIGILGLFALLRKKWSEAIALGGVLAGSLVVAIPYIINLYQASLHPAYEEASIRFGVILTHAPLFVGFTTIAALFIFYFLFPKEDEGRYFFGLALLVTPFITLNQQLITGKVLQAAHYHWFSHKPLAVIVVMVALFYILSRENLHVYKKILAGVIIVSSIGTGIFIQAKSYVVDTRDGGEHKIQRQKYGPVMDWLNVNAQKEEVVFAGDEASHMVVVYTPLNVMYHRAAMYSLAATKDRLLEIIFTFYRLRDIDGEEARKVFFDERKYLSSNIYGMHYRELLGSYDAIPDEKIEEIITRYEETLSSSTPEWLQHVWSKYEVEYVIWDKANDPLWRLDQYPFLKEVAVFKDLAIYSFKQ